MGWIALIILQFIFVGNGIRQERHTGQWSWSKFFFALAFAGIEVVILTMPIYYIGTTSHYFGWVYAAAWVVAVANFVWFIIVCRRWRLPDGRTSLEAARQEQNRK
jgi:ABC-type transport system involved in Fe-S cluster assembly fused permease/ATPase subunit